MRDHNSKYQMMPMSFTKQRLAMHDLGIWMILAIVFASLSAKAQTGKANPNPPTPLNWASCKAFQAIEPCKVQTKIVLSPINKKPSLEFVPDVMVNPRGKAPVKAVLIITNASPFLSCTLAATSSPLTRDTGASFAAFLTTLGTGGLVLAVVQPEIPRVPSSLQNDGDVMALNKLLDDFEKTLRESSQDMDNDVTAYNKANDALQRDWLYRYESEEDFRAKAADLYGALGTVLNAGLPNIADLQFETNALNSVVSRLYIKYGNSDDAADWLKGTMKRVAQDVDQANALQTKLTNFLAARAQVRQYFDFMTSISDADHPGNFTKQTYTTVVMPLANSLNKQVSEAITCQDVVTQKPTFDTLTFTAYYEKSPWWDLSAGAVISLLGGREVGPVSGPLSQGAPTVLAVTSSSTVQFIPAAFFEVHPGPLNFACPWGSKQPRNVCSFGLSLGLLINPNNGTTGAEYFEGVSFGIQRVAFSFGNHTGRYQDFGNGFVVGETVPAGTTPPTNRVWTNRPAFGISYRIPIR